MQLFLYLQFPSLQLDSLTSAFKPGQPLAVVDAKHHIIELNAEAAAQGIALNMSLGSAAALCHQLELVPYNPQQQQEVLQFVAQQLYQYSADIALDPPNGLYLRLNNMLSLYQGLAGYWQVLSAVLNGLAFHYHFATGLTPYAAKCLAKQQRNVLEDDPVLLNKLLQKSPLSSTELSIDLQQQLQRLGLKQLGQLLALSAAELARRFDRALLSYLGRLSGEFYHLLEYIQPEPGFSRAIELMYDIDDTAKLCTPLQSLLMQLEQQLSRANAVCHQLQLQIRFRHRPAQTLSIGSAQGEYRAAKWLRLCQLQLETVRLSEPAVGLKLLVARFFSQQSATSSLFQSSAQTMSSLQLVFLLQARLGHAAVSGLTLIDKHLPEAANLQGSPLAQRSEVCSALSQRPAFLLLQPYALTEAVEIHSGPERLCANIWQLEQQRDYFIGRNTRGQWLWLYRTAQQQWFVQGLFS